MRAFSCCSEDIDAAAEALKVADQFRIHTFISTSTVHVQDKLRRSYDDVVEMAVKAVKHARNYTDDVEHLLKMPVVPYRQLCRMVEPRLTQALKRSTFQTRLGYTVPNEFGGIIRNAVGIALTLDQNDHLSSLSTMTWCLSFATRCCCASGRSPN
ncbi:hypothetical protein O9929_01970 [Vibrio lentus]|nr:hypothetical protein [Vibrio lentus]